MSEFKDKNPNRHIIIAFEHINVSYRPEFNQKDQTVILHVSDRENFEMLKNISNMSVGSKAILNEGAYGNKQSKEYAGEIIELNEKELTVKVKIKD